MQSITDTLDRTADSPDAGCEIAPAIRAARVALAAMFRRQGMPVIEIARRLDVNRTTVWRWLKGFRSAAKVQYAPELPQGEGPPAPRQ